ncbi:bifunctional GNAT family N-acetyltransferase/carbon-nitrogen hydrolase family protein [bacterium]|nr:bifunctional GNAT family N-acetyltransferase/carbon-nitrogen hydrolase family protein [bacterium]
MVEPIQHVVVEPLRLDDYEDIRKSMEEAYAQSGMEVWKRSSIERLIKLFPEGQLGVRVDGKVIGCALTLMLDSTELDDRHTYLDVIDHYRFGTHTSTGDLLYGIEMYVHPEYRGQRLGRRLYDARKQLCEDLNLRGILFGGRIPNYSQHSEEMTPRQYIDAVKRKEIFDPVLNFQLSNDFRAVRVLKGYLPEDKRSEEYAVLLRWDNVSYQKKPSHKRNQQVVRLGLVQWQMRTVSGLEQFLDQMEFFVDVVSSYRTDFGVFPEFFNAPLMAEFASLSEPEAIRGLARFTDAIHEKGVELAVRYNVNLLLGSMPYMEEERLYNVGFLCRRDGSSERYGKIHITPSEREAWGMVGLDEIRTFDTDCGKIGVLVCYDVEFPELGRLLSDQGMRILFVPYQTDTQNGYVRVRVCAQSRAVENECYVAAVGSVGNLPRVKNMDIQFSQAAVFTPSDFSFPTNGIKAEATPNTEMVLIADVDVALLRELHSYGAVRNLKDRRTDLYELTLKKTATGAK